MNETRIYQVMTPAGPAKHLYQGRDAEEVWDAAEEAGEIVLTVEEVVTAETFAYVEPDYVGPLTRLQPGKAAVSEPASTEPEETERDRAAGLGPDHDRVTLGISYDITRDTDSFALTGEFWDGALPLSLKEYLDTARMEHGWPGEVSWVVVEDDPAARDASVTFIAPRGVLERTVIDVFEV